MSKEEDSRLVWDVESTNPELVEALKENLRKVVDPEIGLNVVELGLVRNVTVSDGDAHLKMIMTTPFCPYGPALLEMTRSKAQEALNMPTIISLGFEPWDPSMMEEGAGAAWGFY